MNMTFLITVYINDIVYYSGTQSNCIPAAHIVRPNHVYRDGLIPCEDSKIYSFRKIN